MKKLHHILAGLIGVWGCNAAWAVEVGQPAPDIVLTASSLGNRLSDLRGRYVYVDFWASWCAPCKQSFVWMQALQARYPSAQLTVLAINLDKHRQDADLFLKKNPVNFAVAYDPEGDSARRFEVKAMPSAYLVSPQGHVLWIHRGFSARDVPQLRERIDQLLPP